MITANLQLISCSKQLICQLTVGSPSWYLQLKCSGRWSVCWQAWLPGAPQFLAAARTGKRRQTAPLAGGEKRQTPPPAPQCSPRPPLHLRSSCYALSQDVLALISTCLKVPEHWRYVLLLRLLLPL